LREVIFGIRLGRELKMRTEKADFFLGGGMSVVLVFKDTDRMV